METLDERELTYCSTCEFTKERYHNAHIFLVDPILRTFFGLLVIGESNKIVSK